MTRSDSHPPVIWFYGLSASGKTTISTLLYNYLMERKLYQPLELLDGDQMRTAIPYKFGYTAEDRSFGLNVMVSSAYFLRKNGIACILASILFQNEHRRIVKRILPDAIDIFCDTRLEKCIQRDPKDVYKNNIGKRHPHIVGIDIEFEKPENPIIHLNTDSITERESFAALLKELKSLKII